MKHPKSVIFGEGFGDSHPWASKFNHTWNKPMYQCAACGRSFMRLSANKATDFQLIQQAGIPDLCPNLTEFNNDQKS